MWNFMSCLTDASLKQLNQISAELMEAEAVQKGATVADIEISRMTGFHPLDIKALRQFTTEYKYLMIFRCPKVEARAFIGLLPAKMMVVKDKTNDLGLVSTLKSRGETTVDQWFVSDYDLMSVYSITPNGSKIDKIFFSGTDLRNPRSGFSIQARDICLQLNRRLINKIQHGAQDDWNSQQNRGVKMSEDRYVVAMLGELRPLGDGYATHSFYNQYQLDWPYDDLGRYISK